VIGAGTFISALLKMVTTVAILAAVYVFVIKPTLDTTEKITSSALEGASGIQESIQQSFGDTADAEEARRQVEEALESAGIKPKRLQRCIERAGGDIDRLQRCVP
jgi:peptidoglycan hydrolase CwlO-like protein